MPNHPVPILRTFILALCLTLAAFSFCPAGPLEDLQPGEWYEAPNSKLHATMVQPQPPGNPVNIMNAWSGGAYDTQRDRLLVWGGGHGDYGGNEIYAFDIATLKWSRLWGPSPSIPAVGGACNPTYSDGNPSARHTYDGLEYLPAQDGFWIHGGSIFCGSGGSAKDTWVFNFKTMLWKKQADPTLSEGAELDLASAYDPVTGHVFYSDKAWPFLEFDPAANTWKTRGDAIGYGYNYGVAEIDPKRRQFFFLGTGGTQGGYLLQYPLTPTGTLARQTFATTGDTEILNQQPGLAYDYMGENMVAWGGDEFVYTLDVAARAWKKISPAATNKFKPTRAGSGSTHGPYGRWRYIPAKNMFIGVYGIDANVFFYKLTPAAKAGIGSRPRDGISPLIEFSGQALRPGARLTVAALGSSGLLTVYGPRGDLLRTFEVPGGRHILAWDGRDRLGQKLPGGRYAFTLWGSGLPFARSISVLP